MQFWELCKRRRPSWRQVRSLSSILSYPHWILLSCLGYKQADMTFFNLLLGVVSAMVFVLATLLLL
jgi:hypothetical protein